jgi:hypothetical protein
MFFVTTDHKELYPDNSNLIILPGISFNVQLNNHISEHELGITKGHIQEVRNVFFAQVLNNENLPPEPPTNDS